MNRFQLNYNIYIIQRFSKLDLYVKSLAPHKTCLKSQDSNGSCVVYSDSNGSCFVILIPMIVVLCIL